MRNFIRCLFSLQIMCMFALTSFSQSTIITGNIKNGASGEAVPSVSVIVKGSSSGTFTDDKGNFRLTTNRKLPVTLMISSIGFESQEVVVTDPANSIAVSLVPGSSLGTEVVVSASRVPERILESPVSIERMNTANIRNAAVPNFYEAVANMKGADLVASSINFRTVSTRGFNGSGNLRLNQLVDGMDNQAPALNFAVGNIIGLTELDVENVELLQGASSALYGSGGMNGTLLMTSKNPFKYQGLSFQIKQGVNHIDGRQRPAAPVYDWSFRWGKKVSEKFAFKISGQYIGAQDWRADDKTNLERNNVFSKTVPGNRTSDPNYDGVNVYGDEANTSMQFLARLAASQIPPASIPTFTALANSVTDQASYNNAIQALGGPTSPGGQLFPFFLGLDKNYYGAQLVSRTGYDEKDMVDYNAYNVKVSGGLYYKLTDNVEASLMGYWGIGTTVYTGLDRYNIKNFKLGQYKAEVKGNSWFLRAYTTRENSGDSYAATISAVQLNRKWKSDADWFQQYTAAYSATSAAGASEAAAHAQARAFADQGRFMPGTEAFNKAFDEVVSTSIRDEGGKFADFSKMYHFEGQYNFSELTKVAEILVGANYRIYNLNSNGTIFADADGPININEYGAYVQASKRLFNEILKLTGSIRYDKNENFTGRFTPRITALVKVANDNNIRMSYQSAYRFPSTQDQWINLNSPSARLIGGLPEFNKMFNFDANPVYTAESVAAYRASFAAGTPNPSLLQRATFTTIKPESVNSYELGYRGVISKKLLLDAYVYYSEYKDFLSRVAVARGNSGNPSGAPVELLNPGTTENFSFPVNSGNENVTAIGWGVSVDYRLPANYTVSGNVSGDQLDNVQAGVVTFFNTPKLRYNIGISNNKVYKNFGFNFIYRWQDRLVWEGTFGTGEIPAYGTLDGQISYNFPKTKNLLKIGASNLLNQYYRSAFGNPYVGGLYYVSFGFNVF